MYVKRGLLLFDQFNDIAGAIADFSICLNINPQHSAALEYRPAAYRQRNGSGDLDRGVCRPGMGYAARPGLCRLEEFPYGKSSVGQEVGVGTGKSI